MFCHQPLPPAADLPAPAAPWPTPRPPRLPYSSAARSPAHAAHWPPAPPAVVVAVAVIVAIAG